MPTSKKLMKRQANDVLSQNLKEELRKDGTVTINEDGLRCRPAPTDGSILIIVLGCYRSTIIYYGL